MPDDRIATAASTVIENAIACLMFQFAAMLQASGAEHDSGIGREHGTQPRPLMSRDQVPARDAAATARLTPLCQRSTPHHSREERHQVIKKLIAAPDR